MSETRLNDTARARAVLDAALGLCEEHERADHEGAACWTERLNLLAYLIHSLGCGDIAGLILLQMRVIEYERAHIAAQQVKN